MTDWKPIATAPKNGTPILVFWTTRTPCVCRYEYDDEDHPEWAHKPQREGFKSDGDQCIPTNQRDATHWMPLPNPPENP